MFSSVEVAPGVLDQSTKVEPPRDMAAHPFTHAAFEWGVFQLRHLVPIEDICYRTLVRWAEWALASRFITDLGNAAVRHDHPLKGKWYVCGPRVHHKFRDLGGRRVTVGLPEEFWKARSGIRTTKRFVIPTHLALTTPVLGWLSGTLRTFLCNSDYPLRFPDKPALEVVSEYRARYLDSLSEPRALAETPAWRPEVPADGLLCLPQLGSKCAIRVELELTQKSKLRYNQIGEYCASLSIPTIYVCGSVQLRHTLEKAFALNPRIFLVDLFDDDRVTELLPHILQMAQ